MIKVRYGKWEWPIKYPVSTENIVILADNLYDTNTEYHASLAYIFGYE